MTLLSKLALSFVTSAAMITTSGAAQTVSEGGRPFTTTLSGAEECNNDSPPECGPTASPAAGDPNGTGTAKITVNPGQNRVCWDITVNNIATPTRGHIHEAPAGRNGGIRVTFFETGEPVALNDCTGDDESPSFDRARLKDIIQNPQNYYVNIHTGEWPAGAVRGQLSKKPD